MIVYVLTEENCNPENTVLGVYASPELAEASLEAIVNKAVDDILADDPAETGVDASDRDWLIKDCYKAFTISRMELIE